MYIKNLHARAERRPVSDRLDLYFWTTANKGKINVITGFNVVEIDEMSVIQPEDEGISLSYEDSQALMDSMWNAGVRPSDERNVSGAMKVMYERIDDLKRTITFLETLVHRFTNPILYTRTQNEHKDQP